MGEKYGFEDDIPHEEIKDTDIPKYSDELEKDKREKWNVSLKTMRICFVGAVIQVHTFASSLE